MGPSVDFELGYEGHPFRKQFTVCKVTQKKYADSLMRGQVYARPLESFGGWNASANRARDASVDNNYRGDRLEGAFAVRRIGEEDAIFIDQGDARYMKCYSMVSMEYDVASGEWSHADPRISQFGDTAVVVRDVHTFIDRVVHALAKLYGIDYCTLVADRVSYFTLGADRDLNCMFHKEQSYAWQKEFRILFSRACPFEDEAYWRIVIEDQPVTLEIGDISDIAYVIPVGYLIYGKWWSGQDFRFAMGPYGDKTKFEKLVITSRELIGDYDAVVGLPTLVRSVSK